jgi:hypothetical protein
MLGGLQRIQFPELRVDRLDLPSEDGGLQLEVEVEHGLRLGRERLGFVNVVGLMLTQLGEVAARRGLSVIHLRS